MHLTKQAVASSNIVATNETMAESSRYLTKSTLVSTKTVVK